MASKVLPGPDGKAPSLGARAAAFGARIFGWFIPSMITRSDEIGRIISAPPPRSKHRTPDGRGKGRAAKTYVVKGLRP